MASHGFTTPAAHKQSFTPETIRLFRDRCRDVAAALKSVGSVPDDLVVEQRSVAIPRQILGIKRKPKLQTEWKS